MNLSRVVLIVALPQVLSTSCGSIESCSYSCSAVGITNFMWIYRELFLQLLCRRYYQLHVDLQRVVLIVALPQVLPTSCGTIESCSYSLSCTDRRLYYRVQGLDFRRVVMLRKEAVRTKQKLRTAHEFVVCRFPKYLRISWALLSRYFRCLLRFSRCCETQTNPAEGQLLMSNNQSEIV